MPENHNHSTYVEVQSWYEGHRRDINDLDLSAYVNEKISDVSGGITLDSESPSSVTKIWAGSQAQYDLLTPVATTLYFITS